MFAWALSPPPVRRGETVRAWLRVEWTRLRGSWLIRFASFGGHHTSLEA